MDEWFRSGYFFMIIAAILVFSVAARFYLSEPTAEERQMAVMYVVMGVLGAIFIYVLEHFDLLM